MLQNNGHIRRIFLLPFSDMDFINHLQGLNDDDNLVFGVELDNSAPERMFHKKKFFLLYLDDSEECQSPPAKKPHRVELVVCNSPKK